MINLLLAIDGTESLSYLKNGRLWVKEFYHTFHVKSSNGGDGMNKFYHPGPHNLSLGKDNCKEIYINCVLWLARAILLHYSHANGKKEETNLRYVAQREKNINTPLGRTPGYFNLSDILLSMENTGKIIRFVNEEIKINIIGHSRGGHVAIALNNSLPFKLHFLGLLDAVDRDIMLTGVPTETIEKRYSYLFNAVRNTKFERLSANFRGATFKASIVTREWFGNDGEKGLRVYNTSHGGMGGAPIGEGWAPFFNDITCNATYIDPIQKMFLNQGDEYIDYEKKLNELLAQSIVSYTDDGFRSMSFLQKIVEVGRRESLRVRNDFYNSAIGAGLVLNDSYL